MSVQQSRISVAQRLQKVNFKTEDAAFAAVSSFKKTILDYLLNVSYSIAQHNEVVSLSQALSII